MVGKCWFVNDRVYLDSPLCPFAVETQPYSAPVRGPFHVVPLKDDGGDGDGVIVSDLGGREEARKAARLEGLKYSTGWVEGHDVPTPILDHE